jgi:hypothetical protein
MVALVVRGAFIDGANDRVRLLACLFQDTL